MKSKDIINEARFKNFNKDLSSLLDTYVVNQKQKQAVEKQHMQLVKRHFDNKVSNDEIKKLYFYVDQIMPLVRDIRDNNDDDDLMENLGELIFQIQYILTLQDNI